MAKHEDLVGAGAIHQAAYIQADDPGAVGAWKIWIDITTADAPVFNYRSSDDSAWVVFNPAATGIVDAQIASDAAIALSKLAGWPADAAGYLKNTSGVLSWATPSGGGGGGGGGTNIWDAPASPNADDEEFVSLPTDNGWTSSSTLDASYDEDLFYGTWYSVRDKGSGTGTSTAKYYKAFTRSGDFTAVFRASISRKPADYAGIVVGFQSGHTGSDDIVQMGFYHSGSMKVSLDRSDGGSWSYGAAADGVGDDYAARIIWVGIRRVGTVHYLYSSTDGVTWYGIGSTDKTFTIAEVFFSVTQSTSGHSGVNNSSSIDFIRFDQADIPLAL